MKKLFAMLFVMLFAITLFVGCEQTPPDKISVRITSKKFYSYNKLEEYANTLNTEKYQIIGDYCIDRYRSSDAYYLLLIEKAKNENYEVFEFSSRSVRDEFGAKISSDKKVAYHTTSKFYYLIVITENATENSTLIIKDLLQNDENYIIITEDNSIITVPKNISEIITSSEDNIANLETIADTITKATFCITEEMQNKLN